MGKIEAQIILEVLGRPPEHVTEALNQLTEQLGKEKGVNLKNKTLNPPVEVKESKDLFTSFADLTIEFDSLGDYFQTVFAYMPSHVEVFNPERISLTSYDMNDLANKITQRLHSYDAITKQVVAEREFLAEKLKQHAPAVFKELTTPPEQREKEKITEEKIEVKEVKQESEKKVKVINKKVDKKKKR